jgi:hypothetical protein
VRTVSDEIVGEIYGGKFTEIYEDVLASYVETATSEGVTLNKVSDTEKQRARDLVQPAQVNKWVEETAPQAGIDGEEMQSMISDAISKYDPEGTLRRPYEISQES